MLDGASARAEDGLKDRFAIDLLAQRIRDAEAGLAAAKQTLASLIVRQRAEQAGLDQIERRHADLESRTISALAAGNNGLAESGAAAVAELRMNAKSAAPPCRASAKRRYGCAFRWSGRIAASSTSTRA
ncbi:PspA/IM30 family protein [Mesorhizobium sp. NZP2077]|uniref:PspA/IM30 family protein n=1 Tax=Mesorhizobium sp. NZP2077 TaxID=2483404 RepID=UPI001FED5286|nr:PspA/IM30 family protein [Mesorhizobium sp. NZP2077]